MMSRPSNTKPLDPYDDTYRGPNRQGITQVTDDEVRYLLPLLVHSRRALHWKRLQKK